jgi:hypothetical protein
VKKSNWITKMHLICKAAVMVRLVYFKIWAYLVQFIKEQHLANFKRFPHYCISRCLSLEESVVWAIRSE